MTTRAHELRFRSLALAFGAWALAGCALMSKGTVLSPRYFSPNLDAVPRAAAGVARQPLELRLGQIEAASHLEERMAYRVSPAELGYYDDRRWTEQPYEYLRRALERELFEQKQVRRVVTGPADTLDVELTAFEELRQPSPHVRLALSYTLHDDHESILEQSFSIERPLPPGDDDDRAERVATALGSALSEAVTRVSDAVTQNLRTPARAPCETPQAER